jgi:hypothetical protein
MGSYANHPRHRLILILDIMAAGSSKSSVSKVNPWYLACRGKHEITSGTQGFQIGYFLSQIPEN